MTGTINRNHRGYELDGTEDESWRAVLLLFARRMFIHFPSREKARRLGGVSHFSSFPPNNVLSFSLRKQNLDAIPSIPNAPPDISKIIVLSNGSNFENS